MKKSKHFRKDVILARVIAAGILLLLIVALILAGSLSSKSEGGDKDNQNTQNSQSAKPGITDTEDDTVGDSESESVSISDDNESESESVESESESNSESSSEPNSETNSESNSEQNSEKALYVKTTTRIKLRAEANTNCESLDSIAGGTVLKVEESLEGWYKVTYNGKTGYVSADYAKVEDVE